MSDYPYRPYSPTKSNSSPTRRNPIIPPAGTTPIGGRYGGPPPQAGYGEEFEGWYDGSLSYTNGPPVNPSLSSQSLPFPPVHGIPASLQPARGSIPPSSIHSSGGGRRDYDRDSDLAFGSEPTTKRASYYATGTPDRGREAAYRRRVRTPSTSSTESIPRRGSRQDRERTPSVSPSRPISTTSRGGPIGSQRTPSGNVMNNIFNAENAAAVGSALGSAANFLGSRAGIIKPGNQGHDDQDLTPGGFNSRPVPDTVNTNNNGFNLGTAVDYLQQFAGTPQTPPAPPPRQPQAGGSPFTLSNALNYLQSQTQQPNADGTLSGGIPQRFQLAGIDIDLNWIIQKAGEQNPWVLVGSAVVAFWIISSIIATLMWYGIIAGVLYVVYIVGIKNGGFNAIAGSPEPRRVAGGGGGSRPGAGGVRRRY